MTYTIYSEKDYLITVAKNVPDEKLEDHGEIISKIYRGYDTDKVTGYVLKAKKQGAIKEKVNKLYAIKEFEE